MTCQGRRRRSGCQFAAASELWGCSNQARQLARRVPHSGSGSVAPGTATGSRRAASCHTRCRRSRGRTGAPRGCPGGTPRLQLQSHRPKTQRTATRRGCHGNSFTRGSDVSGQGTERVRESRGARAGWSAYSLAPGRQGVQSAGDARRPTRGQQSTGTGVAWAWLACVPVAQACSRVRAQTAPLQLSPGASGLEQGGDLAAGTHRASSLPVATSDSVSRPQHPMVPNALGDGRRLVEVTCA